MPTLRTRGPGNGSNAGTRTRARGWAVVLAPAMVSFPDDNPQMSKIGHVGVEQLPGTGHSLEQSCPFNV